MKSLRYLVILMLILGSSCKKFLEEKPRTFLTPDTKATSFKDARAFADAPYERLHGLLNGQDGSYGGNTYNLLEFVTGKANTDLGQTGFVNFQNLSYNPTSFYVDTWWRQMYLGVGAANLALSSIPPIEAAGLTEEVKTNMLAEAHALRALFYFYLVRLYGAVPMVTSVVTNIDSIKPARVDAKTIYDEVIIPDLLTAEQSTLPWQDGAGRISMGGIKSLLADVYLTYAGQAINGGADAYVQSAKRSLEVINDGGFSLFPEYTDMINPNNKNKGEFIMQGQYAASQNVNNPLTALTIPNFSGISKYSDEYGSVWPTPEFIASYPAGDKRVKEKEFYFTSYPAINGSGEKTFDHQYIYKYFDVNAVTNTAKSDLNFTIYRLADVMLMYAEASNEAEGAPNANAINYVNQIRARAQLTPILTLSQQAFREEVWLQRYYELAFENKMWFDMIRTRKVHNDVTGNWDDFVGHTTTMNATFTERQLLMPVPKGEFDVNPNVLPNNPGY
jgi:starch-binding outer membrane protein, SusD/RagB family